MREIFLRIAGLPIQAPTPISCTRTKHRFCTACPQKCHLEHEFLPPGDPFPRADFRPQEDGSAVAMGKSASAVIARAATVPRSLLKAQPVSHTSGATAQGLRLFQTFQQESNYDHRSLRAVGALEPLPAAVRSRRGREC